MTVSEPRPLLTVDRLSVHYGRVQALREVSIRVAEGEIVTLIGANGAGKTSLLNAVIGALPPSGGQVSFDGQDISGVPAEKMARLGIGYVPEGRQVFTTMSVKDNLVLGAYSRSGISWKPTLGNLRAWLDGNGVEHELESIYELFPILRDRAKQKAGSLSGGEQQMLAIGRALMCRPRLLLLDEPSMGLSPAKAKEILRLVRRLRGAGLTVLLVEQNAGAALRVADRVYVLEHGRIALEGSAQEMLADRRVQQAYLGKDIGSDEEPDEAFRALALNEEARRRGRAEIETAIDTGGPETMPTTTWGNARARTRTRYIWDVEAETMPLPQLRQLQLDRLQAKVKDVYERVPFYYKAMSEKGLEPGDIRSLDDLRLLPFTYKQDLRDNYPFGLLARPMEEVVRVHASSGTTGKPTTVAYTRNDLDLWREVIARTLAAGGTHEGDIVHNAYGYGLFTGGLGVHYGAEHIGAAVIPVSGGNTKRQIMLLHDFGATVITCTPSFALYLAEAAQETGLDLRKSRLRVGFFGAEPWTERMRREIEAKLPIKAIDIFGLSEIIGPGVATECMEQNGLHIFDDHFLPEIIDPVTGEVLPYGEKGELVITTLTKEALPLIRYRTRDITRLHPPGACNCGRTSAKMDKISGRSDDMLIIRGVNVFPSQIETALLRVDGVEPHYQIIVDRAHNLDSLEVWVEVSPTRMSDEIRGLEALTRRVSHEIESTLGINAKVKLVEPKSIERSEGKAKRVIDRREL